MWGLFPCASPACQLDAVKKVIKRQHTYTIEKSKGSMTSLREKEKKEENWKRKIIEEEEEPEEYFYIREISHLKWT